MSILLLGLLLSLPASAETVIKAFQEDVENPYETSGEYKKRTEDQLFYDKNVEGAIRRNYKNISEAIVIPGTASSAPMPDIARVVGPIGIATSFRIGDTIFLRWMGAPGPREGDRYSTYTPALVLQNLQNPSEFSVVLKNEKNEKNERYRRAGYFYESSGIIRITKISQGIVEAVIEGMSGQIAVGDMIMPKLPRTKIPAPIYGGVQLSAAIVSGSPAERLSTTPRSFIYINRGSRDGVTVGRVFQSVETARLEGSRNGPEMLAGEAIVVYVSDSFSVAMITRQFEVIRIGSLLKSKQTDEEIPTLEPFHNFNPDKMAHSVPSQDAVEEIPNLNELKAVTDPSLPDPIKPKAPEKPSLSELDAIEQANKFNSLSPKEKERLGTLSRQEKIGQEESEDEEAPAVAPVDSSFGSPKVNTKKATKKRSQKSRDEEELNQLMMQN
jgi:hypothetical protein